MVTVSIEEYLTLALDSGKYSVFLIITVIMNVNRSLNWWLQVTVAFIHKENNNIIHNVIVYSRLEVGVLQYLYFSMLTKLNTINYKNLNWCQKLIGPFIFHLEP